MPGLYEIFSEILTTNNAGRCFTNSDGPSDWWRTILLWTNNTEQWSVARSARPSLWVKHPLIPSLLFQIRWYTFDHKSNIAYQTKVGELGNSGCSSDLKRYLLKGTPFLFWTSAMFVRWTGDPIKYFGVWRRNPSRFYMRTQDLLNSHSVAQRDSRTPNGNKNEKRQLLQFLLLYTE